MKNHGQRDGEGALNAESGLAIPLFVEPHIHLDSIQTAGDLCWNESGRLFEGIARWAKHKAELTHEDVKTCAWQTLKWHAEVTDSKKHSARTQPCGRL